MSRASLIPTVVEQTHRGERGWDLFSRLLKDRIVFLGSEIDDDVAGVTLDLSEHLPQRHAPVVVRRRDLIGAE